MNSTLEKLISNTAISNYARTLNPKGDANQAAAISELTFEDMFAEPDSLNHELAACCQSGLWLLHNFLHRSHSISQDIDSAEGSLWHAIMHRTEGDFSNAKYWYRLAGDHKSFDSIRCVDGGDFDPFTFVDQCQSDYRSGSLSDNVQSVAVAEWRALFKFCHDHATNPC